VYGVNRRDGASSSIGVNGVTLLLVVVLALLVPLVWVLNFKHGTAAAERGTCQDTMRKKPSSHTLDHTFIIHCPNPTKIANHLGFEVYHEGAMQPVLVGSSVLCSVRLQVVQPADSVRV
jgi:hypothetical protein